MNRDSVNYIMRLETENAKLKAALKAVEAAVAHEEADGYGIYVKDIRQALEEV